MTMAGLVVREAAREDLPEILRLYGQLHPDDPVLSGDRAGGIYEAILHNPGLAIFVLELNGRVSASCYLNLIPNLTRSGRPYAIIENVVTDELLRGRGLGKSLMSAVLARAWEQGCYKVMLQTGSKRASTHAFYRACGFSGSDKTGYVARPPD